MKEYFDVVVVGDYCLDLIFTGLPALPNLGQEVFGTGFALLPGGTYNTVVSMHRLGLKVGWAGDFGKDEFSRIALKFAVNEGLETSLFVHHRNPIRRITVAASFPQDRAFISFADPGPGIPAGFKMLLSKRARALYVPGLYYGPWQEIGIKLAKAKGMALIMDGNSSEETLVNTPSLKRIFPQINLFMPNAKEACRLTGKYGVLEAIETLGRICPIVVVKDGANGAYAIKEGCVYHSPAIKIAPIETTGAGDCFNAGFIKAWLKGCKIDDCLRWGNIVGGLSTLAEGGTGKVINEKDVFEWLNKPGAL